LYLHFSVHELKQFAKYFMRDHPKLHMLINNAGVAGNLTAPAGGPADRTRDGYERILATNYVGSFLLTELLKPALKAAADECGQPSKVINVSSLMHIFGAVDPDDLDLACEKRPFNATAQYAKSKLAMIMHANELHRRLRAEGVNAQVASLTPGMVRTDIGRDMDKNLRERMHRFTFWLAGKDCKEGAQTTIYVALTSDDIGGQYYEDCAVAPWWKRGWWRGVGDEDKERRLYESTRRILRIGDQ